VGGEGGREQIEKGGALKKCEDPQKDVACQGATIWKTKREKKTPQKSKKGIQAHLGVTKTDHKRKKVQKRFFWKRCKPTKKARTGQNNEDFQSKPPTNGETRRPGNVKK